MTRWITGILVALVAIGLLLFLPLWGLNLIVVLLSLIGLKEFYGLTLKNHPPFKLLIGLFLGGVLCVLLVFLKPGADIILGFLSFILIFSFLVHFSGSEDYFTRFVHVSFFFFGILYTGLLFPYLSRVLALGKFWVFLLLVVTFASDTGAYVFGKAFGKHKLAPLLSPGKTIEGLFGGWLFALGFALIVRFFLNPDYPLLNLFCISSLMAFVGPLGDLSESFIKRAVGAKDSGHIMPGHGGVLDRLDALLFNAPVVYYFAKYFVFFL